MTDPFMRGHPSDIKSTERVAYMLSENVIRFSRPVTRKQKLFDEKGLYLLLTPRGSRLWRFKYRFPPRVPGNKEKCLSLGAYPEVSLERARSDATPRVWMWPMGPTRALGESARQSVGAVPLRPWRGNFSAFCAPRVSMLTVLRLS